MNSFLYTTGNIHISFCQAVGLSDCQSLFSSCQLHRVCSLFKDILVLVAILDHWLNSDLCQSDKAVSCPTWPDCHSDTMGAVTRTLLLLLVLPVAFR